MILKRFILNSITSPIDLIKTILVPIKSFGNALKHRILKNEQSIAKCNV